MINFKILLIGMLFGLIAQVLTFFQLLKAVLNKLGYTNVKVEYK